MPGGQLGTVRMVVSDVPRFQMRQRAVLFVTRPSAAGTSRLINGELGVCPLTIEPTLRQEVLTPESAEPFHQELRMLRAFRGLPIAAQQLSLSAGKTVPGTKGTGKGIPPADASM